MPETVAALLFAHVIGDFILQPGWMAADKARRGPMGRMDRAALFALVFHIAVHGALLSVVLLPQAPGFAFARALVIGSHLMIDFLKGFAPAGSLLAFLTDQAAHLAALGAIAALMPGLWAGSFWATAPWLPGIMALIAGAILTTRAGGLAIGLLMAPLAENAPAEGLPSGGKLIGLLERGMIFVLVLAGQPGGIGFLIAAKSILRFETLKDGGANPRSEYVIIGTLASFGWALVAGYLTLALLAHLPTLGILPDPP